MKCHFALAQRLGLSFWTCFVSGTILATAAIVTWLVLFPAKTGPSKDRNVETAAPAR